MLVEAELPEDVIDSRLKQALVVIEDLLKPVVCNKLLIGVLLSVTCIVIHLLFWPCFVQEESFDYYKKQQLRELAMLNGTLREESPHMSPGVSSPFNSTGMKRAKTGW